MWTQLPPPVQQAAPFIGVGLGTGLVVFAVQQHRLNKQASCSSCMGWLLARALMAPACAWEPSQPGVGAAAAAALATGALNATCGRPPARCCSLQRQRGDTLERQVFDLKKEKAELMKRINALKVRP